MKDKERVNLSGHHVVLGNYGSGIEVEHYDYGSKVFTVTAMTAEEARGYAAALIKQADLVDANLAVEEEVGDTGLSRKDFKEEVLKVLKEARKEGRL